MRYRIEYSNAAAKAFRRIHPDVGKRIKEAIEALADDPRPQGSTQLVGGEGERRIRIGDYRVIYDVEDEAVTVLVLRVDHRSSVYR